MTAATNAADVLAEELAQTCGKALKDAGFAPSERLLEKIEQEIRYAIALS